MVVGVHDPGETQLFKVAQTMNAFRLVVRFRQGGQQHGRQDGNDRDHHQQFNQREGSEFSWTMRGQSPTQEPESSPWKAVRSARLSLSVHNALWLALSGLISLAQNLSQPSEVVV